MLLVMSPGAEQNQAVKTIQSNCKQREDTDQSQHMAIITKPNKTQRLIFEAIYT